MAIHKQWKKAEGQITEVFANTTRLRTEGWRCDDDEPTVHTGKKKRRADTIVIVEDHLLWGLDGFWCYDQLHLWEVVMWKKSSVDEPLVIKDRMSMLAGCLRLEYRYLSSSFTVVTVTGTRNRCGAMCRTYGWHWRGAKSEANIIIMATEWWWGLVVPNPHIFLL